MHRTDLAGLTDDALVSCLSTLCAEGHVLTARIIVHLIEVEQRRLDLRAACTSMFDFCQRRLGMSDGAAFRRITAARLVKRFPALLERIERGELGLSALVLLRPHLTESNVEQLAGAAAGKTYREVEELVAGIAPKPDVRSAIVELGIPSNDAAPTLFAGADARPASTVAGAARSRIEPLSEARFKIQMTAGAELKAKLERARDLMRHRNPNGDLSIVIDAAMDLLLAKLEKERLGKVKAPRESVAARRSASRAASAPSRSRAIPAGVRRAVFERDGEQCTFVSERGDRCTARGHLELDHVHPRALGGTNEISNLRVRCRAHNRLAAEEVFGKEHVAGRIHLRQRKSPPPVVQSRPETPSLSPLPSPTSSPPPTQVIELALRGLCNLGFRAADARRAVDQVSQRRIANGDPLDLQHVLRETIAALT